jgi:hypothetical protein
LADIDAQINERTERRDRAQQTLDLHNQQAEALLAHSEVTITT